MKWLKLASQVSVLVSVVCVVALLVALLVTFLGNLSGNEEKSQTQQLEVTLDGKVKPSGIIIPVRGKVEATVSEKTLLRGGGTLIVPEGTKAEVSSQMELRFEAKEKVEEEKEEEEKTPPTPSSSKPISSLPWFPNFEPRAVPSNPSQTQRTPCRDQRPPVVVHNYNRVFVVREPTRQPQHSEAVRYERRRRHYVRQRQRHRFRNPNEFLDFYFDGAWSQDRW